MLKNSNDLRAMLGTAHADELVHTLHQHQRVLTALAEEPRSRSMVADLLANAVKRRRESRDDDGVARLYREIEAIAQLALRDRHGVETTGDVDVDALPGDLRDKWSQRARDGRLGVGLQDAFALLADLDDSVGRSFSTLRLDESNRSPLTARNQSILAHGFRAVGETVLKSSGMQQ